MSMLCDGSEVTTPFEVLVVDVAKLFLTSFDNSYDDYFRNITRIHRAEICALERRFFTLMRHCCTSAWAANNRETLAQKFAYKMFSLGLHDG
jgi:hypothetical protein